MWRICVAFAAFVTCGNARLGCKNMEGEDVDWFAAIKLPPGVDVRKGKSFVYFDSTQDGWKMSSQPVDSKKSAIGATINQIYKVDKKKTFTIAYNDDSPVKAVESGRGHSKGVAAFNSDVGFWMVHSVPNFPPIKSMESIESLEFAYLQTLLTTVDSTHLLQITLKVHSTNELTPVPPIKRGRMPSQQ
ncbi:deoxyribonuclease II [Ancylostoma ceylanicum]|uniref:Deoxyribonuclease II n=1 Tax=Ancylostoma ceylanicum TaxID=53326 RepID=A0A0D6LXD8_9BILA|nr:deoxyribonuclease II [Ancylostoma ceylanicum]